MRFSARDRRALREDGYVQLPALVSQAQVRYARRTINMSVGNGMDPIDMQTLRVRSFCPELRAAPELMQLLNRSCIPALAESLFGDDCLAPGSQGDAQINLRFPVAEGPKRPLEPHLDGMAARTNGVPTGQLRSFTALVGIYLSDVPAEDCGNFTVWPGSHLLNAQWLRERGARELLNTMPEVDLPAPIQLMGKAGDVVITHYLLSHGTAPNWSADVRYMVFFRLVHRDHEAEKWRCLKEPWLHWPGVKLPPL